MSKIIITGINLDGEHVSETIEVSEPNRTFYTFHRYKTLTIPQEPGLHFVVKLPGLWKRLMRFLGFGKWKTIKKIEVV